ncbi:MAG: hypothetical protein AMXMBFR81_15620 [Chthonomonas sp.]
MGEVLQEREVATQSRSTEVDSLHFHGTPSKGCLTRVDQHTIYPANATPIVFIPKAAPFGFEKRNFGNMQRLIGPQKLGPNPGPDQVTFLESVRTDGPQST